MKRTLPLIMSMCLLACSTFVFAQNPCNIDFDGDPTNGNTTAADAGLSIPNVDMSANYYTASPYTPPGGSTGGAGSLTVMDGTEFCDDNGNSTQTGSEEGPDLIITIPVPPENAVSCADGVLTLCFRGDFNNACEVAFIADASGAILSQSTTTGVAACAGPPVCLDIVIPACDLNADAADGTILFEIRTNGEAVSTGATGDQVDDTCTEGGDAVDLNGDGNPDGNCMTFESFVWPTTVPEIICPPDLIIECTASTDPTETGEPTFIGECVDDASFTFEDVVEGSCPTVITRTWTATICNDPEVPFFELTCDQIITIEDTTPPTITCPEPADTPLLCGEVPTPGQATATDNCTMFETPIDGVPDLMPDEIDPCVGGVITYMFTAVDECGLEAMCMQTFTYEPDTEAPVLSDMPVDVDLVCGDPIPEVPMITATDNCTEPQEVVFEEMMVGTCPEPTVIMRTWTATDDCGNETTYTQTINIPPDDTPPVLSDMPADLNLICTDAIPPADDITATDDCVDPIEVVLEETDDMGVCPEPRIITRTWTATDACMNEATYTQTITIVPDVTPPVLSDMPADLNLTCADPIPPADDITATDDCTDPQDVVFEETDTGMCPEDRIITRTWTATDECGNETTYTQTITIAPDVTPPVLSAEPADLDLICTDAIPPADDITATDDCTDPIEVTLEETDDMGVCPEPRIITRTWTAVDECMNETTYTQTITVAPDVTPPVLSEEPADVVLACGDPIPEVPAVTATDDCTEPQEVVFEETDMGDCPEDRVIIRTWTATDDCGNETTHTQTITIPPDDVPPVLSDMPADLDLVCTDAIPPADDITATDDCTEPIEVVFEEVDDMGVCPELRIITRTWTATDACMNETTYTQTITVAPDVTPPVLSDMPADLNLTCADPIPPADDITATDDCTEPQDVVFEETDTGMCPEDRVITRTWTATDECGNEATYTQTITIAPDVTPPVLSAEPADLDLICTDAIPPADDITATDDCTDPITVTLEETDDMGVCPEPRIITRTWTAVDECMNETTYTQTITIAPDATPPVLSEEPADVVLVCGEPIPEVPAVTATDDCTDPQAVVFEETDMGDCPEDRVIIRTWTATDDCGNETTHTQTITIPPDDVPPVLSDMPADLDLVCTDAIPPADDITATDDCTDPIEVVFEETDDMGVCPESRIITRTWTATDACMNETTYTQTITVAPDTEPPVFGDMPADVNLTCLDEIPPPPTVTATDDCDGMITPTVSLGTSGVCPDPTVITRTWVATDACGNTATYTQTITIAPDETPPVLSEEPADETLTCADAIPAAPTITATDDCTDPIEVVFEETDDMGVCPDPRIITRTWTATDECMNETTYTQTITVEPDTAPPTITCPPDDPTVYTLETDIPAAAADLAAFIALGGTAMDDCGEMTLTSADEVTPCPGAANQGMIVRTYTITDECGNEATCDQTFLFSCCDAAAGALAPIDDICIGESVTGIVDGTEAPAPDYAYDYVLTDAAGTIIAGPNTNGMFTPAAAGDYCIYGVSYQVATGAPDYSSGDINTVTHPTDCIETTSQCFTVTDLPTVTIGECAAGPAPTQVYTGLEGTYPMDMVGILPDIYVFCEPGCVEAEGMGGVAPYMYEWFELSDECGYDFNAPIANTPDASGLGTGTYSVVITDANGCTATGEVKVFVDEPPMLTASPDTTICAGEPFDLEGTSLPGPGICLEYCAGELPVCIVDDNTIFTVCFDFTYTWISDLNLQLQAPNGTILTLVSSAAFPNSDMDGNMCFTNDASVGGGVLPGGALDALNWNNYPSGTADAAGLGIGVSGNWFPEGGQGAFSVFNGVDANSGTWQVIILDDLAGFEGFFNTFTLDIVNPDCEYSVEVDINQPIIDFVPTLIETEPIECEELENCTASYQWTGDDGTDSGLQTIANQTDVLETFPPFTVNPPSGTTTYTLTVTDCFGCVSTEEVVITVADELMAEAVSAECETLDITSIIGGTPDYTITIGMMPDASDALATTTVTDASAMPEFTGIAPGDYYVSIVDANGCEVLLGPITVESCCDIIVDIGECTAGPAPNIIYEDLEGTYPDGQLDTLPDVYVFCEPGCVEAFPTGGAAPLTYEWFELSGECSYDFNSPIANTPDASGLGTGTYTVVVTDANGCTASAEVKVFVDDAPTLTATADTTLCAVEPFDLEGTSLPGPGFCLEYCGGALPVCPIDADAIITVCMEFTHTYISDLSFELVAPDGTVIPLVMGQCCPNGSNDASQFCFTNDTSGGAVALDWNTTGSNNTDLLGLGVGISGDWLPEGGAGVLSGLAGIDANGGPWAMIVTDIIGGDSGQFESFNVTIEGTNCNTVFQSPVFGAPIPDNGESFTYETPVEECVEQPNCTASYQWTGDDGTDSGVQTITPQTDQLETFPPFTVNPPAGTTTYTLTVTDCFGCVSTEEVVITVGEITAMAVSANCEELDITDITGGTPDYTITIGMMPDASDAIATTTVTDASTMPEFMDLAAGDYYISIIDANGCEVIIGPVTVESCCDVAPGMLAPIADICIGQMITTVVDGTQNTDPDYAYEYVLTDANGIIISGPQATGDFTPAASGMYCVYGVNYNATDGAVDYSSGDMNTITHPTDCADATNTCFNVSDGPTVTIGECTAGPAPNIIYEDLEGTYPDGQLDTLPDVYVFCEPGCVEAFPTGGIAPLSYEWFELSEECSYDFNAPIANTPDASGLGTGTYTVVVTDANGCTASAEVKVFVDEAPTLTATADTTLCAVEPFDLEGTSLPGPGFCLEYCGGALPVCPIDADAIITVCMEFTHTFISDLSFELVAPDGTVIPLVMGQCCPNGSNDASMFCFTNDTSGGAVALDWNTTGSNNTDLLGLGVGISGDWLPEGGAGVLSGLAGIDANGGPWAMIVTDIIGGDSGQFESFNVTIEGTNCNTVFQSPVFGAPIPDNGESFTYETPVEECVEQPNCTASYQWTGDDGTDSGVQTITPQTDQLETFPPFTVNPPAGTTTYTLTVTDCFGCVSTEEVVITVGEITAMAMSPECGELDITDITGGTPDYTITIGTMPDASDALATITVTDASAMPEFMDLDGADYYISIVDANGCEVIIGPITVEPCFSCDDFMVDIAPCADPAPTQIYEDLIGLYPMDMLDTLPDVYVFCEPGCASAVTMGGTDPLMYEWFELSDECGYDFNSPIANTQDASGLGSGVYTVVVTDANGCTGSQEVKIFVDTPPALTTSDDAEICAGETFELEGTSLPTPGFCLEYCEGELPVCIVDDNTIFTVCFDFTYTWISDLNLQLQAPNGTILTLVSSAAFPNSDMDGNLCFTNDASVGGGVLPGGALDALNWNNYPSGTADAAGLGIGVSGNWFPEGGQGAFSAFNGVDANSGVWQVIILDDLAGFEGFFNTFTLDIINPDCEYSVEVDINQPIIDFVPTLIETEPIECEDQENCTASYQWTGSDGFDSGVIPIANQQNQLETLPPVTITGTGMTETYILTVTDCFGCVAMDTVMIMPCVDTTGCTAVVPVLEMLDLCSGTVPDLSTAETNILSGVDDVSQITGDVNWYTDMALTMEYTDGPINHSGASCDPEITTLYAELVCNDGTIIPVGQIDITVYPFAEVMPPMDGSCVVTVNVPNCPNLTLSGPTNPTGGADVANWDPATNTYTGQDGDAAGTLDFMVTGGTAPCDMGTITVDIPECTDGGGGECDDFMVDIGACTNGPAPSIIYEGLEGTYPDGQLDTLPDVYVFCEPGCVEAFPVGGTAPLTYDWFELSDECSYDFNAPIANTPDASGLGTGTYTVVVTDADGCTASQEVKVFIDEDATLTTTDDMIVCAGETFDLEGTSLPGPGFCLEYCGGALPVCPIDADAIITVCLEFTHTYISDLSFEIVAPDGTVIPLVMGFCCTNSGNDGTQFCFTNDTSGGAVALDWATTGTTGNTDLLGTGAAISGTWLPQGGAAAFNGLSGIDANSGPWAMIVTDIVGGDSGQFESFNVTVAGTSCNTVFQSPVFGAPIPDNGQSFTYETPVEECEDQENCTASYQWTGSDGFDSGVIPIANQQNGIETLPPVPATASGDATYVLTVTDCFGCATMDTVMIMGCDSTLCTVVTPIMEMLDLCSGIAPDLSTTEADIIAGVADPTQITGVVNWYTDAALTVPYTNAPINHSGASCDPEMTTIYAEVVCNDGTTIPAGQIDYTVYPFAEVMPPMDGSCVLTVSVPNCPNLTLSGPTNPTGGADVANWDAATGTYTGQDNDAAGTLDFMVTGGTAPCDMGTITVNIPECIDSTRFDLALIKTLSPGQAATVAPGDNVSFDITVTNQGFVDAYSILINDYIPAGYTYDPALNPAWADTDGDGNPDQTIAGPLAPGATQTITIVLTVNDPFVGNMADLVNYAEISAADDDTDPNNTPPMDSDSTPDNDDSNDAGGTPDGADDDYIDGDGTGNPNDGNASTDEDDHDPAYVDVVDPNACTTLTPAADALELCGGVAPDLAAIEAAIIASAGDVTLITGDIEWYTDLGLTMPYMTGGPINHSDSDAAGTCDPGTLTLYAQVICVDGTSINGGTVTITVYPFAEVTPPADGSCITIVEAADCPNLTIGAASNPTGGVDIGNWDAATGTYTGQDGDAAGTLDFSVTGGTAPCSMGTLTVNIPECTDDSTGTGFDLALIKTLSPGQASTVAPGDDVSFDITVTNQGSVDAYNILINDYIPAGYTYDPALNPAWADADGDGNPDQTIAGPLAPGATQTITILLTVNDPFVGSMADLVNYAEISAADDDTDPNNTPPTDSDSTPDNDDSNDAGGTPDGADDDYIDGDGTGNPNDGNASTDEDDHDPAYVDVLDPNACTTLTPAADALELCGGVAPDLAAIEAAIIASAGDVTLITGDIEWYTDAGLMMPYMTGGPINHSDSDAAGTCDPGTLTLYAQVICADGTSINGGTVTITVYPFAEVEPGAACSITVTAAACPNLMIGAASNATGGASLTNWDAATNTYTGQIGDAAGTIDIEVTGGTAPCDAGTLTINIPACTDGMGDDCTTLDMAMETLELCGGVAPDLAAIEAAILASVGDPTLITGIVMWYTDAGLTMPYMTGGPINHSDTDAAGTCDPGTITLYGEVLCLDGASIDAGTITITVYPFAEVTPPEDGSCTTVVEAANCPNLMIGAASNPTGGVDLANWDPTTNTYTGQVGDLAGTIDIEVTGGTAPCDAGTITVNIPECTHDGGGDDCTTLDVVMETLELCGGVAPDLAAIEAAILASIGDPTLITGIVMWYTDAGLTMPYAAGGPINHSDTDAAGTCDPGTITLYGEVLCLDGASIDAGTITITVYPFAEVEPGAGCSITVTAAACPNLMIGAASNATGGASLTNWDAATNTYTGQIGDAAGTIDVEVTGGTAPCDAGIITINIPECIDDTDDDCTTVASINDAVDLCGGLEPDLASAEAAILASVGDASLITGTVNWYFDAGLSMPYGGGVINHSDTNAAGTCDPGTLVLYAEILCIDGGSIDAGTVTVTVYPFGPEVDAGSDCVVEVTPPSCPNLTINAVANATGGASLANWDGATNTYTGQDGDLPGTLDVIITGGLPPCETGTYVLQIPGCGDDVPCTTTTEPTETLEICGGLTPDLTNIEAAILAGLGDPSLVTSVVWYFDAAYTMPYAGEQVNHSNTNCGPETVTLYAQVLCLSGFEFPAGQVNITVYPFGPTVDSDGCVLTLTAPDCPNFMIGMASNPTGGASLANWDAATNTYTGQEGDAAGTIDIEITGGTAPCESGIYTLQIGACGFDLALTKTLSAGQAATVAPGDNVSFDITVINQGISDAYNILVTDYVPAGYTYNPALNTAWGDSNSDGNPDQTIAGPLASGASQTITIILTVTNPFTGTAADLVNIAEISAADDDTDPNNTPPTDVDSTPDTDSTDDAGGTPGGPDDDYVDGNGTGTPGDATPGTDEDDHDPAFVQIDGDAIPCTTSTQPVSTLELCGGLAPDLTDAEAAILAGVGDASLITDVIWFTDVAYTMPYEAGDVINHWDTDAAGTCEPGNFTLYAQVVCTDGATFAAGQLEITVYPFGPMIAPGGPGCVIILTPACPGDTFGAVSNATGGVSLENWDPATNSYTGFEGDFAGSLDIEIISNVPGSPCATGTYTLEIPMCGEPDIVPTMGEWGLIIFGLLLMIVAVAGIKQRSTEEDYHIS